MPARSRMSYPEPSRGRHMDVAGAGARPPGARRLAWTHRKAVAAIGVKADAPPRTGGLQLYPHHEEDKWQS